MLYLLNRLFNLSIWIAYIGALTRARQTLLFSATFSKEVRDVAAVTLRQGYTIVDTVGEEVEQTHAHGNYSLPSLITVLIYLFTY